MTDTVVLILCGMSFFSGLCTGWLMWNRPDDDDDYRQENWLHKDRGWDIKHSPAFRQSFTVNNEHGYVVGHGHHNPDGTVTEHILGEDNDLAE